MKALLISPDPDLRDQLRVAVRSVERRTQDPWEYLEAPNGIVGLRLAWRHRPDIVVADQIASGAGGFAVARDLTDSMEPFEGAVVLVLARAQDEWLAKWSGADAWFVKPIDPFALADRVLELTRGREAQGATA